jgi:hypothetical protein
VVTRSGRHARGGLGRAEEGPGRRHVAALAQHGVDQPAVAVDGPVQVAQRPADLQVRLIHMPVPAAGAALPRRRRRSSSASSGASFASQSRTASWLKTMPREEHLAQVPQRQAVAQPPQHHERDDVEGYCVRFSRPPLRSLNCRPQSRQRNRR